MAVPRCSSRASLGWWVVAIAAVLGVVGCGDDDAEDAGASRDAGPTDAGSAASGSGGAGHAGAGAGGVNGRGGHGGSAAGGAGGEITPADGGLDPVEPDAGAPEPEPEDGCNGDWRNPSSTSVGPEALRDDVTVDALLAIPGDVTRIARHPLTHTLYLLTQTGTVHTIDLLGGTTTPLWTAAELMIPTGNEALGMAFAPDGSLYVVTHATAEMLPNTCKGTIVRVAPQLGGGDSFEVFAESEEYPRSNTYFDHEWSGVTTSLDGSALYLNSGSRTDHGEVQDLGGSYPGTREVALTARILRLPTDGVPPLTVPNDEAALENNGWVFARGTRNAFDLELAPNGDLLAPDNGPDGDYHEELNWLRAGHHYGFPWRLGNEPNAMAMSPYDPNQDPRLQAVYGNRYDYWHDDPTFPSASGMTFTEPIPNRGPDADQYRDLVTGNVLHASDAMLPYATFSDHGSPLGLTFDPGTGSLCGIFSGKAFMLRFGVGTETNDFEFGRDLLFLDLNKSGSAYSLSARQLVRGFTAPIDAVLDGRTLYVADRSAFGDGSGVLYAIHLPHDA